MGWTGRMGGTTANPVLPFLPSCLLSQRNATIMRYSNRGIPAGASRTTSMR